MKSTIINKKNAEVIVKYVQEQPKGLFSGLVEGDTRGREGKIKTQIEAQHSGFDLERRSKGVSGAERTLLRRSDRT